MNGIYAAEGIDYQREAFLFFILRYLYERVMADAEMEVLISTEGELVNLDFVVRLKEGQRETELYCEVKGGRSAVREKTVTRLLLKLHELHVCDPSSSRRYKIIHSVPLNAGFRGIPEKREKLRRWISQTVCKRSSLCDAEHCGFPNSVSFLFLPRNAIGMHVRGDHISDLKLRGVAIIRGILNSYDRAEGDRLWHRAENIYRALEECIENSTMKIAEMMRNSLVRDRGQVGIRLNKLIYAQRSFTDDFMATDDFGDKHKYPRPFDETPRDIAFRKFCELFKLNLSIPKG